MIFHYDVHGQINSSLAHAVMKLSRNFCLARLVIAAWLFFPVLITSAAEAVYISEFLAENNGPLRDQDGDESDWIELYNAGATSVNLAGWHLTDNHANLVKWTFPAVNLGPGQYLIVFASGKNRANPGAELHTNFELDEGGDYLGLIAPDGLTIVHDFAPQYPPQAEGISYGITLAPSTTSFLLPGNETLWRVPRSVADFPSNWAALDLDDSSWSQGQIGIGFDAGLITGGTTPGTTNLARGKVASQSSQSGAYAAGLAVDGNPATFSQTAPGQNLPSTWEVSLGNTFPIDRIVISNRQDCCQSQLRDITVSILDAGGTVVNFTSVVLNPENILGGGTTNNGPASLTLNLTNLTGSVVYGGAIRITRAPDPDLSGSGGLGGTNEADVLSLGEVQVFASPALQSFRSMVRTDLQGAMLASNATALLRLPFTYDFAAMPAPDLLTLRLKYDDGCIAYLNGVEVARRNAPMFPAWNSSAFSEHPDLQAVQFEEIDVTPDLGAMRVGDNVLAIQALNRAAVDDDLLIDCELIGSTFRTVTEHYFPTPSPRTNNTTAYLGYVADTQFSVDRGFYEAPISLVITSATPGAMIRYTTNGSPPSLTNGLTYTGPLNITRTTTLRAAAFKPGYRPSNVDTHTYLFVNDVVQQTYQGTINAGYPATWGTFTADYGLDPDVIGPGDLYGGKYAATIKSDLKSIPAISIAMKKEDLFSTNGIYVQTSLRGLDWERPMSVELIYPDNTEGFHVNAGIRLQGGAFRGHNLTRKHSFRMVFKDIYGPGKLHYPLFGEKANTAFDDLVLRANANDSWTYSTSRANSLYLRDSFGRQTLLDYGGAACHEIWVHLYLNGLYWGLYNLVERPDGGFSSAYFGGEKDDWDAISTGGRVSAGSINAWNTLLSLSSSGLRTDTAYQYVQGNNPDGIRNPAYTNYLDVGNMIDYMIVQFYGGNTDWPHNNWWTGRDRTTNSTGFKFYLWDLEWTLAYNASSGLNADRTTVNNGVAVPYGACLSNAEFRVLFGDHVQAFFFDGGPLFVDPVNPQWDPAHPERNRPAQRLNRLADSIYQPIVAESARWGDQQATVPYTRDAHWAVERTNLLNNYFPYRSAIVLEQFRRAGLYPTVAAPLLSQYGGAIPNGFALQLLNTNAGGTIFITFDGSDPRLAGGAVSPRAQAVSDWITINSSTEVRARVLLGTNWSAVVRAVFYTPQDFTKLLVSEIMYHPPMFGTVDGDQVEFLEFKNIGPEPLNLTGLSFAEGITFAFTNGTTLAPGSFFVLARDPAQFAAKYPGVTINGVYTAKLDNAGETLRLVHASGATVLAVTYNDKLPWPVTADGLGFSLVPVNPNANPDPDNPANWRASSQAGGSPGADDPASSIPPILVNEVLSASTGTNGDVIELFNPTASDVNLSGWFLSDDPAAPQKYRIPNGTTLGAGCFLLFDERHFNSPPGAPASFALDAEGDEVYLFSGNAATNLTGYAHGFNLGAAYDGVTLGRYVNSIGEEEIVPQSASTLQTNNAGPKVGPVVITEIMYHPGADQDEFIELKNITSNAVPLFDPAYPTNTWKLSGLGFAFPTNVTIASNGILLLVATNPAAFQAKYLVPPTVPILGPWSGVLQDSGERLELQSPKAPGPRGGVAYVVVDAVRYNDKAPWPPAADGSGPSLLRRNTGEYGNDPINWEVAWPSPGRYTSGDAHPRILIQPTNQAWVAYQDVTLSIPVEGPPPLFYQWYYNGLPIVAGTNASLTLTNLQPSHEGAYRLMVYNESGSAESDPFVLTVIIPVSILAQPASRSARLNSTVIFSVVTGGTLPVAYQWRYNGGDIPGAINSSLVLSNVAVADEGVYSVLVADSVRSILSDPAALTVTIAPAIRRQPEGQTVPVGNTVNFLITATARPMPIFFKWTRDRISFTNMLQFDTNCTLTLSNLSLSQGGAYAVIVTNASDGPFNFALSATAYLTTVLPPTNIVASSGSNVTFRVSANCGSSTSKLRYQWQFNGANLPNFTNTTLNLTNVQLEQQGLYTVQVINPTNIPTAFSASLTFSNPDFDGDGLPDLWELAHGLNPREASDAALDSDGDGMTNLQEYLAGTDPQDPASALKLESILVSQEQGAALLRFLAVSNKTYTLEASDLAASLSWHGVTNIGATPTNRIIEISAPWPTNTIGHFYRLVTPKRP